MSASSPLTRPMDTPQRQHNYNPSATPIPIITTTTTSSNTVIKMTPRNPPIAISPQIGHKRPAGTTPFTPSHQPATPQRRKILAEVKTFNGLQAQLDLSTSFADNHTILSPPLLLPRNLSKNEAYYNQEESSQTRNKTLLISPARKPEKENVYTPLPQLPDIYSRDSIIQSAPPSLTIQPSNLASTERPVNSVNPINTTLFINVKNSSSASTTPSNNNLSTSFSPIRRPKLAMNNSTTHSGSPPNKESCIYNASTDLQSKVSWSRDYSLFEHPPSSKKTTRTPNKSDLDISMVHRISKPVFIHFDQDQGQGQDQDQDQGQGQDQDQDQGQGQDSSQSLSHSQNQSRNHENQEQESIFNEHSSPPATPLQSPTLPIISRNPISTAVSPSQTSANQYTSDSTLASTMASTLASSLAAAPSSASVSTSSFRLSPRPQLASPLSSERVSKSQPSSFITSTPMPSDSGIFCALSLDESESEKNLMKQMHLQMEFRAWNSKREIAELKETIDFLELERKFNI